MFVNQITKHNDSHQINTQYTKLYKTKLMQPNTTPQINTHANEDDDEGVVYISLVG